MNYFSFTKLPEETDDEFKMRMKSVRIVAAKLLKDLSDATITLHPEPKIVITFILTPSKCECGAHKTFSTPRGAPGHSNWCPWKES